MEGDEEFFQLMESKIKSLVASQEVNKIVLKELDQKHKVHIQKLETDLAEAQKIIDSLKQYRERKQKEKEERDRKEREKQDETGKDQKEQRQKEQDFYEQEQKNIRMAEERRRQNNMDIQREHQERLTQSETDSSDDKMEELKETDQLEDLKTKYVTLTDEERKSINNRKLTTTYGTDTIHYNWLDLTSDTNVEEIQRFGHGGYSNVILYKYKKNTL